MRSFDRLGFALEQLRRERAISRRELAERARLRPARLERYLSGATTPRLATLERLLAALEADLNQLAAALESDAAPGQAADGGGTGRAAAAIDDPPIDRERLAREALRNIGRPASMHSILSHEELRALMKQLAAKALAELDRRSRPGGDGKGTDDRGSAK